VSVDTIPEQSLGATLFLQPSVSWPKEMTVGQRHLVAVNLAFVQPNRDPAPWPLPDAEECAYTCTLDGGEDFSLWAVQDAAVVLHRFGGSYGPAEFVVTPREAPGETARETLGERSLRLTIINQRGVPIGDHELAVTIVPANGKPARPPNGEVIAAAATGPAPTGLPGEDLRIPVADDDEPSPGDHPATGMRTARPGTAPTDEPGRARWGFADPGSADTDPLLAGLRPPADVIPYSDLARSVESASLAESAPPAESVEEGPPLRLAEWYNVVGLRRSPQGELNRNLYRLFEPGTPPGERVTFIARCGPSDGYGTVFAVVAEVPNGARRHLELRSVQSARVSPGIYEVTAELLYPDEGHVRFHGLPTRPHNDPRIWRQIMESVPANLGGGAGPAHLIAAIETSGTEPQVAERVDAVRRLFAYVADNAGSPVTYSIVTYGPHSINPHRRDAPEVPVTTRAWAVTSDVALDVLARLARRPPDPVGYDGAAQLECVLTELDQRLTGNEGRPVIVTAGVRTAHPPTRNPASGIIPCIHRRDWRDPERNLRSRHAGIAFGAIHDTGIPDEPWQFLGNDIGRALEDFSARDFAIALGLTAGFAQFLPLPLIDGLQAIESQA
jgi:hypothetical protein